jgi:uncharacterized cupin superfamily protein
VAELLAADARAADLGQPQPLPADDVVAGEPATALLPLGGVGGAAVGLWEMTSGTARDVEADEVFVVLGGRASITVEGAATITVGPGSVVRLSAGDRTVWHVEETLRKVYVTA